MACHEVGPGCTTMSADGVCGGMWTVWAGSAVIGSPSVRVMVASPWMVRKSWWRSISSAQVSVGPVIEWRRMALSPGVLSSHRSVPLWIARSRGRFRNPCGPGLGVLWGEFHFGEGVGEGLLVGALLCGWWGRRLGHLVFWLLWGFCLL